MVLNKAFFFFYNNFIGFRGRSRLKQATPLPRGADLSLRRCRVKEAESITLTSPDECDVALSCPHKKALEGETCCVCLSSISRDRGEEEGIEISVLPCLHEFHKVCVDQWFEECRRTCPVCRYSMEGGESDGNSSNQILTDEMVIWFSSFHTSGF